MWAGRFLRKKRHSCSSLSVIPLKPIGVLSCPPCLNLRRLECAYTPSTLADFWDSMKIGEKAAPPISPQTVAPMPLAPLWLNIIGPGCFAPWTPYEMSKHQNTEKYPQAKFEKWIGRCSEGNKSTTLLRSSVLHMNYGFIFL
ncbi:hypothetical protein RF11_04501 [Thelohanellus kitauei]|uniref:Uncharacterized protein n=1 Tax=Thelohanellus kitauei TaxID=669202 RepID=A0A0C2MXX2_THEKT|nr:hypothetical protein RF11_04501 [Thelohanellus kitauei]